MKDPTETISGTLHSDVKMKFPELCTGSVICLKKVLDSAFTFSDITKVKLFRYPEESGIVRSSLNITLNNIEYILTPTDIISNNQPKTLANFTTLHEYYSLDYPRKFYLWVMNSYVK